MGENQILFQQSEMFSRARGSSKKVSHQLDHLKTPIITSYKTGEIGASALSYLTVKHVPLQQQK